MYCTKLWKNCVCVCFGKLVTYYGSSEHCIFQKVQYLLTAPILWTFVFYGLLLLGVNSKITAGILSTHSMPQAAPGRTGKGTGVVWPGSFYGVLKACLLPFLCIVP